MKRTTLLATSALWILAAPAIADGMLPGGKSFVGLGDLGYDYTSLGGETGGSNDIDSAAHHLLILINLRSRCVNTAALLSAAVRASR